MLAAVVLLVLCAQSSGVASFVISKALPLPTRTSRIQVGFAVQRLLAPFIALSIAMYRAIA
jgi:hypothetical protein